MLSKQTLSLCHYFRCKKQIKFQSLQPLSLCVCVVWLTNKRHLAFAPAGTIVRDPHHRESPT